MQLRVLFACESLRHANINWQKFHEIYRLRSADNLHNYLAFRKRIENRSVVYILVAIRCMLL